MTPGEFLGNAARGGKEWALLGASRVADFLTIPLRDVHSSLYLSDKSPTMRIVNSAMKLAAYGAFGALAWGGFTSLPPLAAVMGVAAWGLMPLLRNVVTGEPGEVTANIYTSDRTRNQAWRVDYYERHWRDHTAANNHNGPA